MPEIVWTDGSLTRVAYKVGDYPAVIRKLHQLVTCNQAEYIALIEAVYDIRALGIQSIAIYSDSELMVNQMNGVARRRNPVLMRLSVYAQALLDVNCADWQLSHVGRERNLIGRLLDGDEPGLANKATTLDNIRCGFLLPDTGNTAPGKLTRKSLFRLGKKLGVAA